MSEFKIERKDLFFDSHGTKCAAWLYFAEGEKLPVIVMAHGLGGTRDMRLDEFAARFSDEGFACFLFDYRNNGDSEGSRRQRINVKEQLEDWESALDYVKKLSCADTENIFVFGTSFSGGHAIILSARHPELRGVVAQCPYTDGFASIRSVPLSSRLKLTGLFLADCVTRLFGHRVMVKLADRPGRAALMTAKDFDKLYSDMVGDSKTFKNITYVTTVLEFIKYQPGRHTAECKTPVYYAICDNDTIAPAKRTRSCAEKTENAVIRHYPCGHFEIYSGACFEKAVSDYIGFYKKLLRR